MLLGMLSFPTATAQGEGWGTPELIESDYIGDSWYPKVAIDPNGNAIAVWGQYDGVRDNIRANRYVAGVGWMTPVLIETNDTGNAGEVEVAVDAAGNAIAVWEQFDGAIYNIWANRYEVGVGWGTAEMISDTTTADRDANWYPSVAIDANSTIYAVYHTNNIPTDTTRKILLQKKAWADPWSTSTTSVIHTEYAGDLLSISLSVWSPRSCL